MNDPAFFGYGSLVNLSTHDYDDPRPARLKGWRRTWQGTTAHNIAYLSVIQDAESEIAGVIARVPGADWVALDAREDVYNRHNVTDTVIHDAPSAMTAVYQVNPDIHTPHTNNHGILRSYLDVVVQGYHQMFGVDGVAAFFDTTDAWAPIIEDRSDPQYPRHRVLTSDETALVDHHLNQLNLL
ncbi:gamma-glutamylcyclotransferase [Loktanella sp. D2R18]|uniref:gamma-glutamylcyclotransferase n=1 Tax=Rhodobacterales TaxID=204455 RepID=UPI000DEB0308|nr:MULTISPECIES: gamma-glutamylcyclotransferase [Rhodobacterales]MDO6588660.1 gamma-glutamylcyclotransferase [Yoonia sp. 1_MG-2023]RBW42093.1 gamma-glutamylcyclotransferase [Loktanella sp. D2R18]